MEDLYWDAIAITAPRYDYCVEFIKELETKQNDGLISARTNIISIPDPSMSQSDQHSKIGSGSSMINSLYVITEKLSALAGKNYLDVDIFKEKRILLLLIGGIHHHTPLVNLCTKSFSILPIEDISLCYSNGDLKNTKDYVEESKPVFCIDIILSNLNRIVSYLPEGLMIASTESIMFMDMNNPFDHKNNPIRSEGVTLFTMDIGKELYSHHGVVKVDPKTNEVLELAYKETEATLQEKDFIDDRGMAQVYTSIVFFSELVAEKILYLYNTPPIDSCTYLGIDNGNQILRFGIYPDILCTMTKNETFEGYMDKPVFRDCNQSLLERGRKVLWGIFRETPMYSCHLNGRFIYLKSARDFIDFIHNSQNIYTGLKKVHSFIDSTTTIHKTSNVTNSILTGNGVLEEKSIISSTAMNGNWRVGKNCVVIGVQSYAFGLHVRDSMICHEVRLKSKSFKSMSKTSEGEENIPKAMVILGIDDDINLSYTNEKATLCNRSWAEFFDFSGVTPDELWASNQTKTLRTARMFPVLTGDEKLIEASLWIQDWTSPPLSIIGRWRSSMRVSISDILGDTMIDLNEFEHYDASNIQKNISTLKIESKQIIEGDVSAEFAWRRKLNFMIDAAEVEHILLSNADKPVIQFFEKWRGSHVPVEKALSTMDRIAISSNLSYCGRILSCISDLLAVYVDNKGGLRSGPARNSNWQNAFDFFVSKNERKGFIALAKERDKWLNSPENMIRSARHYEGAGQIVVKNIVDTCATKLLPLDQNEEQAKFGQWAVATLPARIDLFGGWSDLPPICYEHGGYVINAALKVNGAHPIQVKGKRIKEPQLMFYYDMEMQGEPFICHSNKDLGDYNQPTAGCALLKACLLQLGFIKLEKDLMEQLTALGGGMILCTHSNLPTGSGLGTSSILAAGIVHVIAHIFGYKYSREHLIHAVLKVEQMLTTSGGYQDQVGGVIGGFKESSCNQFKKKTDTIQVIFQEISIKPEFLEKFNSHILLVYTGRTRLAKTLLQDVLRRWYGKTEEILKITDSLVTQAKKMKTALESGDLVEIGKLLSEYWSYKKCMASGSEPTRVSNLFKLISPYCHGISLAGAGGGGFGFIITKEPAKDIAPILVENVKGSKEFKNVLFHQTEIDPKGMEFKVLEK